jgi:hypothetical protein
MERWHGMSTSQGLEQEQQLALGVVPGLRLCKHPSDMMCHVCGSCSACSSSNHCKLFTFVVLIGDSRLALPRDDTRHRNSDAMRRGQWKPSVAGGQAALGGYLQR